MITGVFLVNGAVLIPLAVLVIVTYLKDWATGQLAKERAELAAEQAHWRRVARERATNAMESELSSPITWDAALRRFDASPAGRRLARGRR